MKALDDLAITDRCTLYEDSEDEHFTKTEYQTSANLSKMNVTRELVCQSGAKRKKAPQSEANVCRRRTCILENASLINCTGHPIMHRTSNTNRG